MNIKNFTLMLIAFFAISQVSAQNLVINGDFELWDDTNTPSNYWKAENATQESTEVHGGTFSVMHVGGTKDIAQDLGGIEGGAEYTLSLWYKVAVENDGTDVRIWSYWLDGSTYLDENAAELRGPNNAYLTNSTEWTKYETTITAPAAADSFRFEVRTYSGATVYWDDLSLVKVESTTPEDTIKAVSTIAELRAQEINDTLYYQLTGEALVTFEQSYRGQKYIQDATAAILIDDNSGKITTAFEAGDGITNVVGTLNDYYGLLQFVPVDDAELVSSPSVTVVPQKISVDEFKTNFEDYESELITLSHVKFIAPDTYVNASNYDIYDSEDTTVLRTNFYDVNYIGSEMSSDSMTITGLAIWHYSEAKIAPRDMADIVIEEPFTGEEGINLVINGDFELWDDANTPSNYWKAENATQESTEVHGGTYSVMHVGGTSDITQDLGGIEAGAEYTLSFWYKVAVENDGTDARIWSYWLDGSSTISDNAAELRGPDNAYLRSSSDWTKYETTITAPAAADSFRFEVRTYSGATVYWDDFSLVKVESTNPEDTIKSISTIAELRTQEVGDTKYYKLTGEALVTFAQSYRGQKYIQDETAAILIDDNAGAITTAIDTGDGITNVVGTLNDYYGLLQFVPVADAELVESPTVMVMPQTISVAEFVSNFEDYESELVTLQNVYFSEPDTFENGKNYELVGIDDTTILRSNFYDVDYIETVMSSDFMTVTGLAIWHYDEAKIAPREMADIVVGEVEPEMPSLPYVQTFEEDFDDFTTYSDAGAQQWTWSSNYGATMSGHNGDPENKDYLISPTFSFVDYANVGMTFSEAINFISSYDDLEVLVSTNYMGEIATATFDTLDVTGRPVGDNWTFVTVDTIDLAAYENSEMVTFFFSYSSTASASATWEINNISIFGVDTAVVVPTNHVTDFTATVDETAKTTVELAWTENDGEVAADGYLITAVTVDVIDDMGDEYVEDTDLTDGYGAVMVSNGTTSYVFDNCAPGTEYYFFIYPYVMDGEEYSLKIDDDAPMAIVTTLSDIDAPEFVTLEGEYLDSVQIELSQAASKPIYYTIDGTVPTATSMLYTEPFTLTETATVKAVSISNDSISGVTTADYIVIVPVEVTSLAELRQGATDGTVYRLTGDAVVTMALEYRNQKFIQDATAAVMVYDVDGMIPNTYSIGDGITSVTGTLTEYNGLLELIPVADAKTSTIEVEIEPQELTVTEFNTNFEDYESELIKLVSVEMSATGAFENGTNYDLFDDSDTTVLRTHFYGMDYIGSNIPTGMLNVTGIAICYKTTTQLVPRSASDIEIIEGISKLASAANIYSFENKLYVNNITEQTIIDVLSVDGRKVKSLKTTNTSETIQLNKKGIYLVVLRESTGRSKVQRISIQ